MNDFLREAGRLIQVVQSSGYPRAYPRLRVGNAAPAWLMCGGRVVPTACSLDVEKETSPLELAMAEERARTLLELSRE